MEEVKAWEILNPQKLGRLVKLYGSGIVGHHVQEYGLSSEAKKVCVLLAAVLVLNVALLGHRKAYLCDVLIHGKGFPT